MSFVIDNRTSTRPATGEPGTRPGVGGESSGGEPLAFRLADPGEDVFAAWRMLETRLGDVGIAASADWTQTWLRHYGDCVTSWIVVAESGGQTRGVCLLALGDSPGIGPIRRRALHVGTAGEPEGQSVCVEYNRVLVEPGCAAEFMRGVMRQADGIPGWDSLQADGFALADLQSLAAMRPATGIRTRDCRYFDLRAVRNGEDVIDHLGRNTRSNLRRLLKKYGELETEWATCLDHADDILANLVALHQARWEGAGEPGAFASPRFLGFQRDLVARMLPQGRVALFRVRHQGETVGCLLLLVDRRRLLDYVSGFASFEEKPGPGMVTHLLAMREGLRRGYDAYDFLVGDKRHKENLSTHCGTLAWTTWERPTWRNRTVRLLRRIKQAATRGAAAPAVGEAAVTELEQETRS